MVGTTGLAARKIGAVFRDEDFDLTGIAIAGLEACKEFYGKKQDNQQDGGEEKFFCPKVEKT